ncbi:MAG: FtsQ-type POTRA domain-containing protein [Deltaproteobacteria bacterium]|nr:FtsQ-type POTRA domain-containing protein [Deltaproteobacteria bacterium]
MVSATEHISEEELKALVRIPAGKNIFDVDLGVLEMAMKKHPWIETVKVFRMLPNKIKFIIEEKKPVALLSQDSLYFLNVEGKKIAQVRAGENTDFLIVSGLTFSQVESGALVLQAYELAEEYQKNTFLKDLTLSEVHWDETLGFFLFTKHPSFEIRVGKDEYSKKFARLEKVLKDLAHKSLAPKLVDLNYSKKVVVKLSK